MNVCYVAVDVSLPAPDGGSTHTLELARALHEQGNEVHILSRRKRGQARKTMIGSLAIKRIYRMIIFPAPFDTGKETQMDEGKCPLLTRFYHLYLKTILALFASIEISGIVRKNGIDLIIERADSLGAGAIAARLTRRPLIVEMISDWSVPFSLATAKKILVYSVKVAPTWVDKNKILLVPASVNTRLFNPYISPDNIRGRYFLGGRSVIAYCGSFCPWHGVDTIIEASKAVIHSHPQSVFLMIGPDYYKYKSYAKQLGIADHFIFTGPVTHEEVPDFLACADILLAPYFPKENKGEWMLLPSSSGTLKLLEYLAMQKPVIATKIPPIESVIENNRNGILIQPGDSEALGREINRLIENPELAQQIAKQGYQLVTEKYTWDSLARVLVKCARSHTEAIGPGSSCVCS